MASQNCPVLARDGVTLLTDQSDVLHRWREHFEQLLNQDSTANTTIIEQLQQRPVLFDADAEPSAVDVAHAVKTMGRGKAAGKDGIQAELLQIPGSHIQQELTTVLRDIWRQGHIPQDFKDAIFVPILVRMEDHRLPKAIFYGELQHGSRPLGRPLLRFKDCLKQNLKLSEISLDTWESDASDSARWRSLTHTALPSIDKLRAQLHAEKKARRCSADQPCFSKPLVGLPTLWLATETSYRTPIA